MKTLVKILKIAFAFIYFALYFYGIFYLKLIGLLIFQVITGSFDFSAERKVSEFDELWINIIFLILNGACALIIKYVLGKWIYIVPIFILWILSILSIYYVTPTEVVITSLLIGITYTFFTFKKIDSNG